jgi:hypothetical protein
MLFFLLPDATAYVAQLISTSHLEVLIHVHVLSFLMADFAKTVHVHLTYERGKVFVFEVFGEDFFCKLRNTFDVKGVGRGCPTENWLYSLILCDTKNT